jgi:hypothetical protein
MGKQSYNELINYVKSVSKGSLSKTVEVIKNRNKINEITERMVSDIGNVKVKIEKVNE